jgi:hypothetical protein
MISGTPSVMRKAELLSTTCGWDRPALRAETIAHMAVCRSMQDTSQRSTLHGAPTATAMLLTTQPAAAATGPSFLLMEPPALNRAMSTSLKLRRGRRFRIQRQSWALLPPSLPRRCRDGDIGSAPVLGKLLDNVGVAVKLLLLARRPACLRGSAMARGFCERRSAGERRAHLALASIFMSL